jgi:hypothetical protein
MCIDEKMFGFAPKCNIKLGNDKMKVAIKEIKSEPVAYRIYATSKRAFYKMKMCILQRFSSIIQTTRVQSNN